MTEIDMIHKALEPYGFVNKMYGNLPYSLTFSSFPHRSSACHYHVIIDRHVIAEVDVHSDGTYTVRMELAEWLKRDVRITGATGAFMVPSPDTKDAISNLAALWCGS
jgi:hypothetical protein